MSAAGGQLHVADRANPRIDRFDPTNFAGSFTSFGTLGSGAGPINAPTGITADGLGNIFVADQANSRIVALAATAPIDDAVIGAGDPSPGDRFLGHSATPARVPARPLH